VLVVFDEPLQFSRADPFFLSHLSRLARSPLQLSMAYFCFVEHFLLEAEEHRHGVSPPTFTPKEQRGLPGLSKEDISHMLKRELFAGETPPINRGLCELLRIGSDGLLAPLWNFLHILHKDWSGDQVERKDGSNRQFFDLKDSFFDPHAEVTDLIRRFPDVLLYMARGTSYPGGPYEVLNFTSQELESLGIKKGLSLGELLSKTIGLCFDPWYRYRPILWSEMRDPKHWRPWAETEAGVEMLTEWILPWTVATGLMTLKPDRYGKLYVSVKSLPGFMFFAKKYGWTDQRVLDFFLQDCLPYLKKPRHEDRSDLAPLQPLGSDRLLSELSSAGLKEISHLSRQVTFLHDWAMSHSPNTLVGNVRHYDNIGVYNGKPVSLSIESSEEGFITLTIDVGDKEEAFISTPRVITKEDYLGEGRLLSNVPVREWIDRLCELMSESP
ncbi:MAG TPA: hypothetical protein DF383_07175, partial [Deltaproteobacteria bacterium]|nr:hypothetical protein [Deltaproteobacteria bacterium]